MTEDVVVRFIDKMGTELLFCIGIIVILSYIVVKAIPIVKDIRLKQLEYKTNIELQRLELDKQRELNALEAAKREDERDRARTEVIGTQNDILSNIIRSNEAMTLQMASLNSLLMESKDRSKALGDMVTETNQKAIDTNYKVTDTNRMVTEIHDALVSK